jgi:hypothetical protein
MEPALHPRINSGVLKLDFFVTQMSAWFKDRWKDFKPTRDVHIPPSLAKEVNRHVEKAWESFPIFKQLRHDINMAETSQLALGSKLSSSGPIFRLLY